MSKKLTALLLAVCMASALLIAGFKHITAETEGPEIYAQETVQGSVILHCFNWSYNSIKTALPQIAAAGYTAVQTSPVQEPKDYGADWTDSSAQWWKLYQPLGISIADGGTWLGTRQELIDLCGEAEDYGIKVIVDIVANHLANDEYGGTFSHLNENVYPALRQPEYYHDDPNGISDDNRWTITQRHMGMPDLNTGHDYIQDCVLGLLCDCVDCGVDGFRFDAAKHIELPTDGDCASDFWPTVISGVLEYADRDLFIYGEILGGAGTDISNYTAYMAVTDNVTGDNALDKANRCAAGELADSTYHKGAAPAKSVLWAESHDTYMSGATSGISDEVIAKAWAIVGARAYSTALYLARPNAVMGEPSSDTAWSSKTIAEVNKFKNHFNGANEYLSSYGNAAYIERGNRGVVISKLDGAGEVSLPVHRMENGTYTDQITGNAFTVADGSISGTVGESCVAVVYNADDPAIEYITASPLYLEPSSKWLEDGARFAMYLYNSATNASAWADMTDADGDGVYAADLPYGDWNYVIFCRMDPAAPQNDWTNKWNQTEDLFPDENTNCFSPTEGTWDYGGGTWRLYGPEPTDDPTEPPSNSITVYAINNAGWSGVNVHYWGEANTAWPGLAMEPFSGNAVYSAVIPAGTEGIVFNNGISGNMLQTGDITSGIGDGAVFIIHNENSSHWSPAPTYYLAGSMNGWAAEEEYAFTLNPSAEGRVEYMLASVELPEGAQLKVTDSSGAWYPDGEDDNYTVAAAGTYNVYFRPNHDGGGDWHEGWFYLENAVPDPVTLRGDANNDGLVNVTDALCAMRHAMNIITLDEQGAANADVDGNGVVNTLDALNIMRMALLN